MENKAIMAYEHSRLSIGEQGFNETDFKALLKYNDLHGNKYFTVGYNKITFKSYVGVIQAGNKIIEILPKADNSSLPSVVQRNKWQNALLFMLKKAGYLKQNETQNASQQLNKTNLLDVYLYIFIKEVETLLHAGLIKKYRRTRENQTFLKGKLLLERQIQVNVIHKELFFIEHNIYDKNNHFNKILKKALEVIKSSSTNATIKGDASNYLFQFINIDVWEGADNEFDKLVFDRKTQPYKYAIELARMIILNYCPDMTAGNKSIIAILFDMNKLFEKFVYSELKKQEINYVSYSLNVSRHKRMLFWKEKIIEPDIILSFKTNHYGTQLIVVDTKWKILYDKTPADDDLKQLFTYNIQFGALHSVLFYPSVGTSNQGKTKFTDSPHLPMLNHHCEMYFAQLFDENDMICESFAPIFIEHLIKYFNQPGN